MAPRFFLCVIITRVAWFSFVFKLFSSSPGHPWVIIFRPDIRILMPIGSFIDTRISYFPKAFDTLVRVTRTNHCMSMLATLLTTFSSLLFRVLDVSTWSQTSWFRAEFEASNTVHIVRRYLLDKSPLTITIAINVSSIKSSSNIIKNILEW